MINILKSNKPLNIFNYNDEVIVKQIKTDFFYLCYTCEGYYPRSFEIDHFYPQSYFPLKKNNWDNLFLICSKCNKTKIKNINTIQINKKNELINEEILNCCVDDVENNIILNYDLIKNSIEIKILNSDIKTINTKKLLERIYEGKSSNSRDYIELKKEIRNKIIYFNKLLDKYNSCKIEKVKNNIAKIIKNSLEKKYNLNENIDYNLVGFLSFKRQIIKNNPKFEHFKQYFD